MLTPMPERVQTVSQASPDGPGAGTNEWFDYLQKLKLRTYFNDHPFPVANQTTPTEVAFRYTGLEEWIGRGLRWASSPRAGAQVGQ